MNGPPLTVTVGLRASTSKKNVYVEVPAPLVAAKVTGCVADVGRARRVGHQAGRGVDRHAARAADDGERRCRVGKLLDQVNLSGLPDVEREAGDVGPDVVVAV